MSQPSNSPQLSVSESLHEKVNLTDLCARGLKQIVCCYPHFKKSTVLHNQLDNNYVLYVVIVTTAGTPWLPSGIHTQHDWYAPMFVDAIHTPFNTRGQL